MSENLVVSYKGGLGNQLFQYAFKRYLEHNGKQVKDTITRYFVLLPDKDSPFVLSEAFSNIHLDYAYSFERVIRVMSKVPYGIRIVNFCFRKLIPHYFEPDEYIFSAKQDPDVLSLKRGILDGQWNSYKYAESVRGALLKEMTFQRFKVDLIQD